jgi:hypothetical protein
MEHLSVQSKRGQLAWGDYIDRFVTYVQLNMAQNAHDPIPASWT